MKGSGWHVRPVRVIDAFVGELDLARLGLSESKPRQQYLEQLDRMDRRETPSSPRQAARLKERIATLKDEMRRLEGLKAQMEVAPDGQVSLTDPDARSMASQGTGIVGYNVQTAVDTQHHLPNSGLPTGESFGSMPMAR
jgi:hypothetical protein